MDVNSQQLLLFLVVKTIGRKAVIFVNGCFWHGHGCKRTRIPQTNREYWRSKIERNMRRDAENIEKLNEMDWRALVIWECNLADPVNLGEMVQSFLEGKNGA